MVKHLNQCYQHFAFSRTQWELIGNINPQSSLITDQSSAFIMKQNTSSQSTSKLLLKSCSINAT